jgi:LuxR family transcriptional regulator, maltose regulon positive regulatory protein
LPLPWSIELACRLCARGDQYGARLIEWLVDHVDSSVLDELRWTSSCGDAELVRGAAALLRRVPIEPQCRLRIEVLGPLGVLCNGRPVEAPELRRARVRELLCALVVDPRTTRDRLMAQLWPELDMDDAARNLRVTLSYLRRVLEPDRGAGEAGYHLRADSTNVQLFASPKLHVDVWDYEEATAAARRLRIGGDLEGAIEQLKNATALWRGRPLEDLARVADLEHEVDRLRIQHLASLLELGELHFAQGAASEASACAEQALAVDAYSEAAHRLLIASAMQRHDRLGVVAAVDRLGRFLDELGVDPEPSTQVLVHQANRRYGLARSVS